VSWVFDATPLIYLAKAERLDVVGSLDGPRLVPERVYHEVVTDGLAAGYTDARRIERHVDEGVLDVVEVEEGSLATRLADDPGLSGADVAVLACAGAREAVAVVDEAAGRSAAAVEGIETRGTAYLVLTAVSEGGITPTEGRDAIDTMLERGWYVAPDLYARILTELESFEG